LAEKIRVCHFDCGGCNGCDLEVLSFRSPERYMKKFEWVLEKGIQNADVMLVSGPVTKKTLKPFLEMYRKSKPKIVVALGTCACSTCVYIGGKPIVGPLDKHVPVDIYLLGCPPRPAAILKAIESGIRQLKKGEKAHRMTKEMAELRKEAGPAPEKFRGLLYVDKDVCIGCKLCTTVCPNKSAHMVEGRKAEINYNTCCFCGQCAEICPVKAIRIKSDYGLICSNLKKCELGDFHA
jgi:Ni,Fe-hydrogenase III small subunit/NAD-dependent dihydropyrimidine dehydrogenase PreA subunit